MKKNAKGAPPRKGKLKYSNFPDQKRRQDRKEPPDGAGNQ